MAFATISKFLLVLAFPFLLFLLVLNSAGFDDAFYREKLAEYGIEQDVPEAALLHEKVLNFVAGKADELPQDFNNREKGHLADVRSAVRLSRIFLYSLIFLFVLLLIISIMMLKLNNLIGNFVGKVLVFGGLLTIGLSGIFLIFISLDFTNVFESFHLLFFERGTYSFDPSNEIMVRLYPEQLFMDLGLRITKWVFFISTISAIIGMFLIVKAKRIKIEVN